MEAMGICRVELGSDVVYGLALTSVSRIDLSSAEYLEEVERLLSSMFVSREADGTRPDSSD